MKSAPLQSKPTELEQAAAERRSFGNSDLAANAEFKVIAEALRELVTELRLIRQQVDKLVVVARGDSPAATHIAPPAGTTSAGA